MLSRRNNLHSDLLKNMRGVCARISVKTTSTIWMGGIFFFFSFFSRTTEVDEWKKERKKKEKTIPNNLLDTNTYLGVLVYQH